MASIELVLAMLLAVVVSGYLVRALPIALPLPLVQIALGGVIAGVLHHGVTLQPAVFFLLFLPPLLFLDGWRIPKDGLLRDRAAILQLALGLVVFTVVGAGYMIHWLLPAVPLAVAFALAAVLSPTDPVAVSSIASRAPIPRRMMHILEGESLLNDASGLVCFEFAVAAVVTGSFSPGEAALAFLWVALAGLACGVAFTLAVAFVQQRLTRRFGEEGGSPILISLLIPFGAYLLAERIHASGILAAVAAGITMSYVELSGRSMATTRLHRTSIWNTIQFTLNGIMFVVLGEQLPAILEDAVAAVAETDHVGNAWWLAVYALAITIALGVLRLVWVWASLELHMWRQRHIGGPDQRPGWRLVIATSLAGVRGTITLAGILSLPLVLPSGVAFPARALVIFLAAAVILLSLLGGSVVLPRVLHGMRLPAAPPGHGEEDRARMAAASRALDAIRKTQDAIQHRTPAPPADLCANAASRVIAMYQRRLERQDVKDIDAERLRTADALELELRLAGLRSERAEVLSLARHREISDETSRRLVREIDLREAMYR